MSNVVTAIGATVLVLAALAALADIVFNVMALLEATA